MPKSNLPKFQFSEPENGWMTVTVSDDEQDTVMEVSDVPCDSLSMLTLALERLFAGAESQEVTWSLEPEYWIWRFKVEEETLRLEIGRPGENAKVFSGALEKLIHRIWKSLRDLESKNGRWEDSGPYWKWAFPSESMRKLGERLQTLS